MQEPQELELWRYLKSQRELAGRLIEGESLEQVAPRFLEIVANLLRWEAGAIWEVVGNDEPLRLVSGWSEPELDARPLWRRSRELTFKRGTGLPGDAWDTGRIATAPVYRKYPTTAPATRSRPSWGWRRRWRFRSRSGTPRTCWPWRSSTPPPSKPSRKS